MQHAVLGKLLELWRLIAVEHAECINPLGVWLGVEVIFARISPKLCLDCMCNQVLDLFDGRRARRPVVLELTSLL